MNILVVLHSHICGGAETHALMLMKGLVKRGHRVAFAGPRDSWLGAKAEENHIELMHVPMHGMTDIFSMLSVVMAARKFRAHLIHGHLVRGTHYATIAGRVTRRPTVATAHSTISYKRFNRAAHIIAVSQAVKDSLVARHIKSSKITRIYHGIPDRFALRSQRQEVRKKLALDDNECALCMTARFIPDKGHDFLLHSLSRLKDGNCRLFLAGDDTGRWARETKTIVKSYGLEGRVVFLGFQENVPRFLAGMDILLAPSRREALSISIIEALSMGLPVIGTRTGGIPEVIRHGENGLLVEMENLEELLNAISSLAAHPKVCHAYGLRGRQLFLQQFSEKRMVDGHVELYRSLIPHSCADSPVHPGIRPGLNR